MRAAQDIPVAIRSDQDIVLARQKGRTLAVELGFSQGDATLIAGYLGMGDSFDQALRDYAVAYADQVEQDYETFQQAVRAGRFPVESLPSETEQALR